MASKGRGSITCRIARVADLRMRWRQSYTQVVYLYVDRPRQAHASLTVTRHQTTLANWEPAK